MSQEEKNSLIEDYSFRVIHYDFPFNKVRPELKEKGINEEEIVSIIKEIDDVVLLNTVESKLENRKYEYRKSGIGILFSVLGFLFYLSYGYGLIEIEGVGFGVLSIFVLVVSGFFYQRVRKRTSRFVNRNKFKNN